MIGNNKAEHLISKEHEYRKGKEAEEHTSNNSTNFFYRIMGNIILVPVEQTKSGKNKREGYEIA